MLFCDRKINFETTQFLVRKILNFSLEILVLELNIQKWILISKRLKQNQIQSLIEYMFNYFIGTPHLHVLSEISDLVPSNHFLEYGFCEY